MLVIYNLRFLLRFPFICLCYLFDLSDWNIIYCFRSYRNLINVKHSSCCIFGRLDGSLVFFTRVLHKHFLFIILFKAPNFVFNCSPLSIRNVFDYHLLHVDHYLTLFGLGTWPEAGDFSFLLLNFLLCRWPHHGLFLLRRSLIIGCNARHVLFEINLARSGLMMGMVLESLTVLLDVY